MSEDPASATTNPKAPAASWVRLVVDWGGPACFLIGYLVAKKTGLGGAGKQDALLFATWALVAGSAFAIAVGFLVERRVAPVPLFSGIVALVFGGLTLAFQDSFFIKLKPTFINLVLGAVMLGGVAMRKNPLKVMFNDAVQMSEGAWRKLTVRYGVFFLFVAVLNLVVWRTQPEAVWVLFRMPGLLILTVLFSITQVPVILKEAKALEAAAELEG